MTPRDNHQQLTLKSNSSFLYSFFFLPKEKRQAIYTLYAFCRQTDDIADNTSPLEKRVSELNWWERELKKCFTTRVPNYFDSLKQVAERFKIPFDHFLELIAGVRMDLNDLDYHSFDELKLYCYRVASIVGLMCIEIFGYRDPIIKQYAENLGIALQLTNIIRDVGTDANIGRVYLPREDLDRFQIPTSDILSGHYSPNFNQMMTMQAGRAHQYYQKADECLPVHERRNMLVAEMMKNIYFELLEKIESRNFRVLSERIRLSSPTKFWITFRTIAEIRLLG